MTQSGVLPASYAPYDRFVRLAVLKALNHDGQWIDDAQMLPLGSGLLHSVFEPHSRSVYHYRRLDEHGMPAGRSDGYTQYCVMYAPEQQAMYLQPFDSTAWTKIALRSCDTALLQRHPINRSAMAGVVDREEKIPDFPGFFSYRILGISSIYFAASSSFSSWLAARIASSSV